MAARLAGSQALSKLEQGYDVPFFKKRNAADQDQVRARELEATLASINRSQAAIEFELDGTIITANENFLKTMGYSLSEIKGRHHSMFVQPAFAKTPEYQEFWRALNAGRFMAGKFQRVGAGGKDIWIQGTYNPLLDANGKPYKIIKFATEITAAEHERIKAEADRRRDDEQQGIVVAALAESLGRVAKGDLTAKIEAAFAGGYQQIKDDFNRAIDSLRDAMQAISATTGSITSSSNEIAQASGDLSRRTEQQAASLEETAAALDQITATVKRSAEGAKQANDAASSAKADALKSGEVMNEAISAMSEIQDSSAKVTQIIGVIDEIAFQTNLLALNAGVEAARAGDAGRGFAVVAQEVRALAQRSADAAKEIKTLIANSSDQVQRGVRLVGDTGAALSGIVTKVTEIDALIGEIASSSREQATGLTQVNTAVNEMDSVTQQNAAMVEEATAAAASLRVESTELTHLVARFQTGEERASVRPEIAQPHRHAPARNQVAESRAKIAASIGPGRGWPNSGRDR
jgi:methyl-accepting chemotaxis protein